MGATETADVEITVAPRWRTVRYSALESAAAHVRRIWKSREVTPVRIGAGLADARIVALLVVKDERPRFPFLLDFYRRAGVDHFLVVDNESSDDLQDYLLEQPDVSVYVAHGVFSEARYGTDWINHVARRHCVGRWVLFIDADELLMVPGANGDLAEVCDRLERAGRRSLHALLLDMYSERPASANVVAPGANPLETCPLYDQSGYERLYDPLSQATWIKGGVRGRLFFEDILAGPALNKTPLVHWRRWDAFAQVAHRLVPRGLNRQAASAQAALLHFKFTSINAAKFDDEETVAQHTAEYEAYSDVDSVDFRGEPTTRFTAVEDLVDHGMIGRFDASEPS